MDTESDIVGYPENCGDQGVSKQQRVLSCGRSECSGTSFVF